MSGAPNSASAQNRFDFAALAVQLARCSEVALAIVEKVKQDRDVPAALKTELSALQEGLQLQLQAAEHALQHWPEAQQAKRRTNRVEA